MHKGGAKTRKSGASSSRMKKGEVSSSEESYDPDEKEEISSTEYKELKGLMIEHSTKLADLMNMYMERFAEVVNKSTDAMHEDVDTVGKRIMQSLTRHFTALPSWAKTGDVLSKTLYPIIEADIGEALKEPTVNEKMKKIEKALQYIWNLQVGITSREYGKRIQDLTDEITILKNENESLHEELQKLNPKRR